MKKSCFIISLLLLMHWNLYGADAQKESKYDAEKIADIFYALNGDSKDPKKKINHSKGFCAVGEFTPANGLSVNIPLFSKGKIPVEVRYSLGGAITDDRTKTRGMALRFLGGDAQWTMVMLNTEINFAKNLDEFGEFFEMRLPVDGKVDTKKIAKRTQEVHSYKQFDEYVSKIGVSRLENTPYHSIHTFKFDASKGKDVVYARWKFVPKDGVKYISNGELSKLDKDFLLADFKAYTAKKPIEYDMYLVFPNKGDAVDDTTALWTGDHKEELVGTLVVSKYNGEGCNPDVFFPSDLPAGVSAPEDPLFDVRNLTYGITFGRRQ